MSKAVLFLGLVFLLGVKGAPTEVDVEKTEHQNPKSIFTTIQSFIQGLYQEFLNRQQSIANLLACGNCVNEGWEAIMAAVANVPGLEWAVKPQADGHPPNFFTALNHDGIITGFGGSIVDNKPVVEFVFDHTGIIQHLNTSNHEVLKH